LYFIVIILEILGEKKAWVKPWPMWPYRKSKRPEQEFRPHGVNTGRVEAGRLPWPEVGAPRHALTTRGFAVGWSNGRSAAQERDALCGVP